MANEAHLARLQQGVEAWNQWREANVGVRPDLRGVYLTGMDLTGMDLHEANLEGTRLVRTKFERANLTVCKICGISAWSINLTRARQADLVITPADEPVITVDNLDVAQFIYLLLHNDKIREVIETITS